MCSTWFKHVSQFFAHSDWKEKCELKTGLCIVFYPVQNLIFVTSSESLVVECKRSKRAPFETCWQVSVYFRVFNKEKFSTLIWEINSNVVEGNVSHNVLSMRQCGQCIRYPRKIVTCKNFDFSKRRLVNIGKQNIAISLKPEYTAYQSPKLTHALNLKLWKFCFRFWTLLTIIWPKMCNFLFDASLNSHKSSWLTSEIGNFSSCFDILLSNIGHFESSKCFICDVFWDT